MKLNKRHFYFSLFLILTGAVLLSCHTVKKTGSDTGINNNNHAATEQLQLTTSTPPIDLGNIDAKFYKDIQYDISKETVFDIILPQSAKPASLVVFIHGGGFIKGDKKDKFKNKGSAEMIKKFLSNNIAFASINYRLLTSESTQGVLQCLNDSKRALQFIRLHSKTFHIDKDQVVLMGGSAGAGTSLWIAFNDDMADKNNPDPVLRESTRVMGVVAMSTQATYNFAKWNDIIFKQYRSLGFDAWNFGKIERRLNFYGFGPNGDTNSAAFKEYGQKVDMLELMSSDDPEMFVSNAKIEYRVPTNEGEVIHHPLQAKALMDEAQKKGVKGEFYIPKMNINTTNGESEEDFVLRLIGAIN